MLNTNLNTICMITIQHLMSEHFSDSISNRSTKPEKNSLQRKYITRLEGYNTTDQLCDKESSLTDLQESWSHKELLHNRFKLINHTSDTQRTLYSLNTIESTMEIPTRNTERSLHSFKTIKTPTNR